MNAEQSLSGGLGPSLMVRADGSDRSLPPSPSYLIGRDPECDIVVADPRVSRQHAVLRLEAGRWVLADNGSTNGTYVRDLRVDRVEIDGGCLARLGHPADGPVLSCTVSAGASEVPDLVATGPIPPLREPGAKRPLVVQTVRIGPAPGNDLVVPDTSVSRDDAELMDIPYAVRWLVPRGERFANFPILNDNDTQLEYYRRFGHIYAVGIPAKKWRLVVVSDPELLDEVAEDEEQFGKRVEEINFFDQLAHSRGGGISVIGDGAHYEQVRRVMLPWYSPQHQRTQLERMKDQARKLVADWAALPAGEPVDARAWMERYTLEVSGRGACAYDFGLLGGEGAGGCPHPFAAAVPASTKESILRVAEPRPDFTILAGRARRARKRAYRAHNAELYRTAGALVAARAHTAPLGQQTDLLSRLLSTPDPQTGQFLDHETVRDQVLMHLSNGFNGPSITGAWLAYILATRPDVEEKLLAEIDGITGGDPGYDLAYDDLMALTYTTQVIKETMRIYPPLPVTIRRSLRDGTLGRYRIRKGDIILVGSLAAQRDPRYWGPDPGRFDPGQFAPDKVISRPRHAMIPFSIGRRQCMAQEVTFMMLRVVLFEIAKHYRLRLAPGATVTKNTVVSTKPAAVPVILLPRQPDRPPAPASAAALDYPAAAAPAASRSAVAGDRGQPTEIPQSSAYRHLVIAYGSNFVCPENDEEQVERLARHLGAALDGLFMAPSRMNIHAVPKGVVLQVRNVLTNLVDITGRPTVPLLDLLLDKAADAAERSGLAQIRDVLQAPGGPASPLRDQIDSGGYDVVALLDEFGSCTLNMFEFLQVAQPLRPRYYSISSSPHIHGAGVAHITVGHQITPVPGRPGRHFRGMSSHHLHALREGDRLNVFIDSAAEFGLQHDLAKPMIFVSAGTGLAPMRAFLRERQALKQAGARLGEAALFNGIRSARLDNIYRDEIEQFTADEVLDHVHVAMSRERSGRREYVQDKIRQHGALIWRLLTAGGYVYVCGAQPMRDAVRAAFADVIAQHGRLPREHAETYLHDLETTARYRPDLWG
jgi:cytochrome P450/ferredoxin-NADP reductase